MYIFHHILSVLVLFNQCDTTTRFPFFLQTGRIHLHLTRYLSETVSQRLTRALSAALTHNEL